MLHLCEVYYRQYSSCSLDTLPRDIIYMYVCTYVKSPLPVDLMIMVHLDY